MAHWIIEDVGSAGTIYTCSSCGTIFNNVIIDVSVLDQCPECDEDIDEDENEYV